MLFQDPGTRDIEAMAQIRAREWGEVEYWQSRIAGYLDGRLSPQHALAPRHCVVAIEGGELAGFVAGHLTRRFECDGEIQWINVAPEWRGKKVASELLRLLATWFLAARRA